MSKKRRHKSAEKSGFLSPKKIRQLLFRVALVGVGVAAGVLARPSLIQDPAQRALVDELRNQVLTANEEGQKKALQVLGSSSETIKETVGKVSGVADEVTGTDPQVLVNEKVAIIKQEVKNLPQNQIKKIKLEFCQDVIKEEVELACQESNN
ncbi:MAG: hypothetical protein HYS86_00910 [Candidatus Chisholmbacteria bacterium]|nr:hypothetical protein [Candidatus Chisholmbacteria bacterium]